MKLGLVTRKDSGGIAAQTLDLHNHLNPYVTLVVDLNRNGRGPNHTHQWNNPININWQSPRKLNNGQKIERFVEHADIILTVETYYGHLIQKHSKAKGIPTIRVVNPELYKPEPEEGQLVLQTEWEQDRPQFENAKMIPQAIEAPDNIFRDRTLGIPEQKRPKLFIPGAPAMLDRNGVIATIEALDHVETPCDITFKNIHKDQIALVQNKKRKWPHIVQFSNQYHSDRWEQYKPDYDLTVIPRRYGGNSLTMFESAAAGIPVITTDLSPQNEWFPQEALAQVDEFEPKVFVGGKYNVYSPNIASIAERIEQAIGQPKVYRALCYQQAALAETYSWEKIRPVWFSLFEELIG